MLTSFLLFVVGQATPILVTQPIVLAASRDIKHAQYVWASTTPGTVFEIPRGSGIKLWSSTGDGVIDGAGIARAVTFGTETSGCRLAGITIRKARLATGSVYVGNLSVTMRGGSRATQSGGRNVIDNCVFEDSGCVEIGGFGHYVKNSVFWRSPDMAVHQGIAPLAWDKPNDFGVSKLTLQNLQFIQCAYTKPTNWDGGVVYAGRSFGSNDCRWERLSFYSCNGDCVMWDDGQSFMYADRIFGLGNKGRLLMIGGGTGNTLLRVTDVSSALASVWDDRMNARNGVGGLDTYQHGAWHAFAHNGPWSHGTLSGPASPSIYGKLQAELRAVLSPEALNWRTALGTKYLNIFTNESTFATSGKIEYRAEQGTKPIENGYGQPLNHPGVTIQSALPM